MELERSPPDSCLARLNLAEGVFPRLLLFDFGFAAFVLDHDAQFF